MVVKVQCDDGEIFRLTLQEEPLSQKCLTSFTSLEGLKAGTLHFSIRQGQALKVSLSSLPTVVARFLVFTGDACACDLCTGPDLDACLLKGGGCALKYVRL